MVFTVVRLELVLYASLERPIFHAPEVAPAPYDCGAGLHFSWKTSQEVIRTLAMWKSSD